MPQRAVDDDFFQTRGILKGMVRQELHIVKAKRAQAVAVAEAVLPQFDEVLRKFHLRQLFALIERPS